MADRISSQSRLSGKEKKTMKPTTFNPDKFMIDAATDDLQQFMPDWQLATLRDLATNSEEKEFFIVRMVELAAEILSMPKTYEQDGKGDQAVAYLHYFNTSMDWYITEKDTESDQLQAFGYADLGHGCPELGYISIQELIDNSVELDLYFRPATIESIKLQKAA
jgi:hypothetical protein